MFCPLNKHQLNTFIDKFQDKIRLNSTFTYSSTFVGRYNTVTEAFPVKAPQRALTLCTEPGQPSLNTIVYLDLSTIGKHVLFLIKRL